MSEINQESVVSSNSLFDVDSEYIFDNISTDVVFTIKGQQLSALKSVLIRKNNVFRAMFSGNFKESKDNEVVIEGTTFEAFKTLILFLSYNQLVLKDNNDLELIEEVYKLSDRYECPELLNRIIVHLNEITITFENFALFSKIAFKYEMKELIEKVSQFFDNNLNDFVNKVINELQDTNHKKLMKLSAINYQKICSQLSEFKTRFNLLYLGHCICGRFVNFRNNPINRNVISVQQIIIPNDVYCPSNHYLNPQPSQLQEQFSID